MDKKDDGGPAFPQQEFDRVGEVVTSKSTFGMSLRDYFAAAALQGILANARCHYNEKSKLIVHPEFKIEQTAYKHADTMLDERSK